MTRVNVGIEPRELCDQHLIAECAKELPRLWKYIPGRRSNPDGTRVFPDKFTLNKGHELSCARYLGTMAERFFALRDECLYRDFSLTHRTLPDDLWEFCYENSAYAPQAWIDDARPLLQERIVERLCFFTRTPTWTCRPIPTWIDLDFINKERAKNND